MNFRPKKIVLVGEVNSGKTWLWQSYFHRVLPEKYTQTIFDNHCTSLRYKGKEVMKEFVIILAHFSTVGKVVLFLF